MRLEERQKFFLKRELSVVGFLTRNVATEVSTCDLLTVNAP